MDPAKYAQLLVFQLILPFQLELPFEPQRLPDRRRKQRRRARGASLNGQLSVEQERRTEDRRAG